MTEYPLASSDRSNSSSTFMRRLLGLLIGSAIFAAGWLVGFTFSPDPPTGACAEVLRLAQHPDEESIPRLLELRSDREYCLTETEWSLLQSAAT